MTAAQQLLESEMSWLPVRPPSCRCAAERLNARGKLPAAGQLFALRNANKHAARLGDMEPE